MPILMWIALVQDWRNFIPNQATSTCNAKLRMQVKTKNVDSGNLWELVQPDSFVASFNAYVFTYVYVQF